MTSAAYHFVPWARQGMPTHIEAPDPLDSATAARASIPLTVRLSSRAPGSDPRTDDITMSLSLYGPGDVVGVDPREVVRTVPLHLTAEYPSHLFAAVEFDRPDFPWLLTPAAPNGDRLRPWVVLVVVPTADAAIAYDPGRPLPTLTCRREELPDLSESWMWVHAQFAGAQDTRDVASALLDRPAQSVSRLLCPRHLKAGTSYLACVVPSFAVGRLAGLGEPTTEDDERRLEPAWDLSDTGKTVQLPVYYSWEFSTAAAEGDFEDLVDRLQLPGAKVMPPRALMDMSRPGRGLPEVDGAILGLHSALHLPGATTPEWPSSLPMSFEQFQEKLRQTLAAPSGGSNRVPPPIYGSVQAVGARVDAGRALDASVPPWLRTLNLDPRYRAAAALGVQVVRDQQEQLMSSAWRQAGELADANRWLAQKQLAREVTRSVYEKRLKALSPGSLQQVIAPVVAPAADISAALTRMPAGLRMPDDETPNAETPTSGLIEALTSTAFRRISRPRSPMVRVGTHVVPEQPVEIMGSIGTLMNQVVQSSTAVEQLAPALEPQARATPTADGMDMTVSAEATSAADATLALLHRLNPEVTYAVEARTRLQTTTMVSAPSGAEGLAPLRLTPTFPQPMYEPLRDMFRDMLLPGLDRIPDNSVVLLGTNPAFIEAYMVGLNEEMGRELLWREFPSDLRGSFFRQFWDVRSQLRADASDADRERLRDIPLIAEWTAPLGSNLRPERGRDLVMLLIKGDLLVRFPTAVIFAARARWPVDGADQQTAPASVDDSQPPVFPSLTVEPVPGVRLLGFDIPGGSQGAVGDAAPPGDPGWFIVIQEHPTEPRFGLNANRFDALTTWRKLAWSDVAVRGEWSYIDSTDVTPSLAGTPSAADRSAVWGRTGADMAYITLQKAYRLEVHAGRWLA